MGCDVCTMKPQVVSPEAYERGGDELIRRGDEDTHGDEAGPALPHRTRDVRTRRALATVHPLPGDSV